MALPGGEAETGNLDEILDRPLGLVAVPPREQLRRRPSLLCGRRPEPATAAVEIALVDVTGSTRHLATNPPGAAEEMVDALFEAGQAATLDRPVRAIKYVGDGVFLAGGDPSAVALAAFGALDHIQRSLPLSARAGLPYVPLLRRAGGYFVLPVNLAPLVTKVAD